MRTSHTPVHYTEPVDLDFTGSPIVVRARGCPALVAAENKNGHVYVYRLDRIGAGLHWARRIAAKLNGQPAWSPRTRSLYVVGHARLFRLALQRDCSFRVAWSIPLGSGSVNGPPVVAGDVLWFSVAERHALLAVDAASGEVLWTGSVGEPAYAAPTVLDGRVYVAGFSGMVKGFG